MQSAVYSDKLPALYANALGLISD